MPYKDRSKRNEYAKKWVKTRREAFFAGKSCAKCNSTDGLQLDHVDRSTKVTHKVWSMQPEKAQIELAKCQVLCAKCHKEKTRAEREAPHGLHRYHVYGCRCEICVAAKVIHNKTSR